MCTASFDLILRTHMAGRKRMCRVFLRLGRSTKHRVGH